MITFTMHTDSLPSKEERESLLGRASVIWAQNDLLWVIVDGKQICVGPSEDFDRKSFILDERHKI
jgi:hypothetical protein